MDRFQQANREQQYWNMNNIQWIGYSTQCFEIGWANATASADRQVNQERPHEDDDGNVDQVAPRSADPCNTVRTARVMPVTAAIEAMKAERGTADQSKRDLRPFSKNSDQRGVSVGKIVSVGAAVIQGLGSRRRLKNVPATMSSAVYCELAGQRA